jgi:hypothetical protein
MKYFWFFSILIVACGTHNGNKDVAIVQQRDPIIGNWSMCSEKLGKTMIQYNMCVGIVFRADGSGNVITPSQFPEGFRYKKVGALLLIVNTIGRSATLSDSI